MSAWSSKGLELGDGDFIGAKVGVLADGALTGRGVAGAGLDGEADCGRKLVVPERAAALPEAELGELLTGLLLGLDDEDGVELDDAELVKAEPVDADEFGDEGGFRPGVPVRAPPPCATARAAAASAGLEAPLTGAAVFFDGGGVAIVAPEAAEGAEVAELGRELLDGDPAERLVLEEDCEDGLDGATAGRPLLDPDDDGVDDDFEGAEVDGAEGAEAGRAGTGLASDDGVAAGRAGTAVGRDDAGVGGGVDAGGALVTGGPGVATAGASGRGPDGRARVVSSAPPSLLPLDVAFGDASVLIGTVPPPGICRDVLSDRWLLSELTFHLHAQAADGEPSSRFRAREPLSISQQVHRTPLFGRY